MCGIIAYKGGKDSSGIVIRGLKQLEYRGYDSWGIASVSHGRLSVVRCVGKISDFRGSLDPAHLSVGHTRWATQGSVTEENAHPHLSSDRKIAVVHNGIVENYYELRHILEKKGYSFQSECDTEIFPVMIEDFMKQGEDFEEAVRKTLLRTEGSFAIVAVHEDKNMLIGARRGSPLVLGIGNGEFFLASDVPAFLEHTNKVIYLDDDEYCTVQDNAKICSISSGIEINKEPQDISWGIEQARKGDYPHFMLKEISEQKSTVKSAIEQPHGLVEEVASMLNSAFGIFFVGCGTSYHACISASYIFSKVAKKHVNVVLASEFRNYEHFLTGRALVIAVSQSGETADVLDAVKFAKKHGCRTLAIVNVMGSTLMRLCDKSVMMNCGPEICVLSTKSYTSQLAILLLLAYASAGKAEEGRKIVKEAAGHAGDIIDSSLEGLKALAEKLKNAHDMFLIGRDLAYPSALEGALKIKEVSYIHAEGFAGAELKHGTIALIEKGVPCIVLSTPETEKLIASNAAEIRSRGGYIIGIGSKKNEVFDYFIDVPEAGDANPVLMILPVQVLAYYLALARNLDPDFPRNLAKSVTVK